MCIGEGKGEEGKFRDPVAKGYYIGARQEAFCKKSKHRSLERYSNCELLYG